MILGSGINSSGEYDLSGDGQLSGTNSGTVELVGYRGPAPSPQTGTSKNTVTGGLSVGVFAGSSGVYSLQNGQLVTGREFIGDAGNGSVTQGGGVNETETLTIGNQSGSTGEYTLNDGSIQANTEYIGNTNGSTDTADFNQQGGTNGVALQSTGAPSPPPSA